MICGMGIVHWDYAFVWFDGSIYVLGSSLLSFVFFLLVFFFGQIDDLIQRFSLGKVLGFDVRNEED